MKISLCITVFNEEKSIERLLESIVKQTKSPDEVIIVDGGSSDATVAKIKKYESTIKGLRLIVKKGNRPFGRNESIRQAGGEIIAITDAGCELDKSWLLEITKPFMDKKVDVVSGYYAGKPQNSFQASLVPYVLVMPDNVNPSLFLPSTRSMAMRKMVWEKMGGFPELYRWNEDYVFAKQIEKNGMVIKFAPHAIVYWFPRETAREAFLMFYAFAKGDAQAGIGRPKVVLLLARVFIFILLCISAFFIKNSFMWELFSIFVILYLFWAIFKSYRYVKTSMAVLYLPVWQIISDIAVSWGTTIGYMQKLTGQIK